MIDAVLSFEQRRVILVDGFNVLHAVLLKEERDAGWWRRELRERLLRRVSEWPGADDALWVAFDGAQPSWSVWAEPVATLQPPRARARRAIELTSRRLAAAPRDEAPLPRGVSPRSPVPTIHEAPTAHRTPTAHGVPTVHSVYVESADDWIVRRARRTSHPERTVVVTADRQVAGRARSAGCETWTPWAFMARCSSQPPTEEDSEETAEAQDESRMRSCD